MDGAARYLRSWPCVLLAALATCGCATLRRKQAAPDAVAACRQLSRESVAAMERGDGPRAQSLLEEAVSASPSDVDARRQLAEVLWQAGSRQEAVVHMEAAVRLDPRHAPTLVRSGEMLLALGSADKALVRAERAMALDSTLPSAWALRGRVFRSRGDNERALADMHQALRFNPHDP
jgi:Tfp pilus assembly protein PilF